MKCKNCMDCDYIIYEPKIRGGGAGTYKCTHPNAQDNWGQSSKLCRVSGDEEFSLKRIPRWCPLLGYKISMGYEKLLVAAFPYNFTTIKQSEFLEEREKLVILAHYQDGKTYASIAKDMGVSKEAVRKIEDFAMDRVRLTLYNFSNSENLPEAFSDLSVRSKNALTENGLKSIEAILKYISNQEGLPPEKALMQLKNIGTISAKEICYFLQKAGGLQITP